MNCVQRAAVILTATIVFVVSFHAETAEAKRGCVNFGHSCYGGMGKRGASDMVDAAGPNEEVMQNVPEEENPAFVFTGPRSFSQKFPRQQQRLTTNSLTPEHYDNIAKFFKEWILNIRRERATDNMYKN